MKKRIIIEITPSLVIGEPAQMSAQAEGISGPVELVMILATKIQQEMSEILNAQNGAQVQALLQQMHGQGVNVQDLLKAG